MFSWSQLNFNHIKNYPLTSPLLYLCFFGLITEALLCFLEVSHFLDFFSCSLKSCICCLHIWRMSHVFQSFLIGCRKEMMSSVSPAGDSKALRPSLWMHPLHTSCSLLGRILKIVGLLWILQSQAGAESLLFAFPMVELWNAQFCMFPPYPPIFVEHLMFQTLFSTPGIH